MCKDGVMFQSAYNKMLFLLLLTKCKAVISIYKQQQKVATIKTWHKIGTCRLSMTRGLKTMKFVHLLLSFVGQLLKKCITK